MAIPPGSVMLDAAYGAVVPYIMYIIAQGARFTMKYGQFLGEKKITEKNRIFFEKRG